MKKALFLSLVAASLALGATASIKQNNFVKEDRDAQIIIQLKDNVEKNSVNALVNKQNSVLQTIRENITPNIKVNSRFTNIFSGFTLEVPSAYVTQIRSLPSVKRVNYNNMLYHTSNDETITLTRRNAVNLTEPTENVSKITMEVPDGTKEGEGVLIGILDTGGYIYYDNQGNPVQHEVYTELPAGTKLKIKDEAALKSLVDGAKSFHGKYDKNHSTYWSNKVPFYYDYGGDTNKRNTIGLEDYDVFSKSQEHGTHVASIAAGNSPTYKGIAPKAQIAVMKVFTCYTPTDADAEQGYTPSAGAYENAILEALEDCAVLGVDIVNMSLGSTLNDFDNDSIVENVIKTLKRDGMYINHAAGNDGKYTFKNSAYEYWTTDNVETGILSSYSNNPSTIEIAAAQADKEFYESAFIVGSSTVSFRDQIESYTSTDGEVVYDPEYHLTDLINDPAHSDGMFEWFKVPGLGDDDDYDGLDDDCLQGKIAIIDRGDITFVKKITNAKNRGAIAVGIIDNDPSNTDFTFRMDLSGWNPGLPVVSILYRDKPIFDNATDFTAKIVVKEIAINPAARTMTDFSSDGASFDLQLKPDIATPGQNILGAINEETNSYEYYNGTSMATPNYCGVMALLMSDHLEDANYRKTINARLMSTATPMYDGQNPAEGQEKAFASVRKQGAGLVNVKAAIDSKVYLDGSTTSTLSDYAKISLGNNADIANGKVKLSFSAINEGNEAVSYEATTYIYRPDLVTLDEENYPEFKDVKLQSTDNHLIAKVTNNVTFNKGTTVINLPEYELSNEAKQEIDDNFPNGTFIEGFVVLKAAGKEDLSIPFLGFYGDYSKGEPVEPFKFEKQPGKIYGSDLVNSIVRKWKNLLNADFSSDWLLGNYDKFSDINTDDALLNQKSFRQLVDGNTNTLIPATTNPYTGEMEGNDIYVGNNGFVNTMIITQFVLRSVATNDITLTNKATNEVVLRDHMFDDLHGATEDDEGNDIAWPLYKSEVDTSYWSNDIIAHRAYTLIPLYKMDKDNNKLENFPDGEYEMKFSYVLAAGGTFEKTYTIHIDSDAPTIKSMEKVNVAGADYIRVRYAEQNLSYVIYQGNGAEVKKDENGYYFDVPFAEAQNGFFLRGYDYSYASTNTLFGYAGDRYMSLSNVNANGLFAFEASITDSGEHSKNVTLSFTKDNLPNTLTGAYTICLQLFEGMNPEYIRVYQIDNKGKESLVKSEVNDGFVTFTINSKTFKIDSTPYTAVQSVTLDKHELTLEVGQTSKLTATILPAGADQTVSWSSSNKSVASVANDGVITAKKAGTVVITATSPEFKEDSCTVTINAAPKALKSISVSGAKNAFTVGEAFSSEGLKVVANYDDGSSEELTSGFAIDSSKADMSKAGSYTITVTYEGLSATYQITVSEVAPGPDTSSNPDASSNNPDSGDDKPSKKGCGSIVASSSLVMLISLMGIGMMFAKKKRR